MLDQKLLTGFPLREKSTEMLVEEEEGGRRQKTLRRSKGKGFMSKKANFQDFPNNVIDP